MLGGDVDVPEETLKQVCGEDRTRASRMVHQIDYLGTSGHGVHVRQAEERELLLRQLPPCSTVPRISWTIS